MFVESVGERMNALDATVSCEHHQLYSTRAVCVVATIKPALLVISLVLLVCLEPKVSIPVVSAGAMAELACPAISLHKTDYRDSKVSFVVYAMALHYLAMAG